jgi:YHS domain-containing protein
MQARNGVPCRLERDPVCGRELTREQAPLTTVLRGRTYRFCSERCRTRFTIRPGWFVDRSPATSRRAS